MQQQKKPFSLMVFIKPHRAGFITSVILAVLSVASGMVPYFAVARMVNLLISGEKNFSIYLAWGAAAGALLLAAGACAAVRFRKRRH